MSFPLLRPLCKNVQLDYFFSASNCDNSCHERVQLHSVHVDVQTRLGFGASRRLSRHPAAFHCQAVTDCGEGALASCLDMEAENAERGETACGSGGMEGCRRAWPLDKECDSCYRGLRDEGGSFVGRGGGGCCWTGGGPRRPFIYFDPRAAGGPGRAHAILPRRAEPPRPPPHLSARPSVSGQIYVCLWQGCIGDTALF